MNLFKKTLIIQTMIWNHLFCDEHVLNYCIKMFWAIFHKIIKIKNKNVHVVATTIMEKHAQKSIKIIKNTHMYYHARNILCEILLITHDFHMKPFKWIYWIHY